MGRRWRGVGWITAIATSGGCSAAVSHIIIVDSDPTAALVTQRGLQHILGSGSVVEQVPSAGAAWLACARGGIDLVIIDPGGPDRSGVALLKALHHEHPGLTVLVLTAYDTPRLRKQMAALGVRGYLAKPVGLAELGALVRQVVTP